MAVQRIGPASRIIAYPEGTVDSDAGIVTGYILPLSATDGYSASAPLQEAPIYMGDANAPGTVPGEINAGGPTELGLEFLTFGYILKSFFGSSAVPVATAGGYMHYFPLVAAPLTMQLQKEWMQAPAQYLRTRGNYVDTIALPMNTSGAQKAQVTWMGYGDEAISTDLAGTKVNNGYVPSSAFYGAMYRGGLSLATVANTAPSFSRKMSRQSVGFNNGFAGSINAGLLRGMGPLDLLFDTTINLQNYQDAVNGTQFMLEFVWLNAAITVPTQLLYVAIPLVTFERNHPHVGGEAGLTEPQQFKANYDPVASALPGFVLSGNGPFNIGAATNKLGLKPDGGATQTVTLTQGAARTAAQIVADIGTLPLTGGSAQVFPGTSTGVGGRFRVSTATKGAAGSMAVDTTVANSAHTILGLDNVVRAGKAAQTIHAFLLNPQSTQF